MTTKDYYAVLGVTKDASKQEIKKAYQKLAKKWHPDVNKATGAEAKFKELSEAYEIVGNEGKRKEYDEAVRMGARSWSERDQSHWQQPPFGGGFAQRTQQKHSNLSEEELFRMFFGDSDSGERFGFDFTRATGGMGSNSAYQQAAPEELQARLEITLEQAYKGEQVQVQLDGKEIKLSIPARSISGTIIRLANFGKEEGRTGRNLQILVEIKPHSIFQIEGSNLIGILQIAPWQAVLGGEAKTVLPDGRTVNLKIPAGIQFGKRIRLSGQGLRNEGRVGDILFDIEVIVPAATHEAEKELYRRLAESSRFHAGLKKRDAESYTHASKMN